MMNELRKYIQDCKAIGYNLLEAMEGSPKKDVLTLKVIADAYYGNYDSLFTYEQLPYLEEVKQAFNDLIYKIDKMENLKYRSYIINDLRDIISKRITNVQCKTSST